MEEKVQAISVLSIFSQVLEGAFAPFAGEVLSKAVIPGLAFFINDSVRSESAQIVPYLLNSLKKAGLTHELSKAWEVVFDALMDVLMTGQPVYLQTDMYQCFYESVEVLGKDCLTAKQMAAFVDAADSTLKEYEGRLQQRVEDRQDNEEDESAELLEEIDEDRILLSDMNKAFHTIFKSQGISFLPAWSRLLHVCDRFAASREATQRQWAICLLDDAVEYCDEQSWTYQQHIRGPITNGLQDPDPAIRQAACYGVGVAALKGGQPWSAFAVESLPALFGVSQAVDRENEDQMLAGENACAAIAKVLQRYDNKVPNAQEVTAHWLTTLPIIYDDEAAPYAYMYLVKLIDQ